VLTASKWFGTQKFNVKPKKSKHEEISLHDNADAGHADRIGNGSDEGLQPA
jgi:hypothetical protein